MGLGDGATLPKAVRKSLWWGDIEIWMVKSSSQEKIWRTGIWGETSVRAPKAGHPWQVPRGRETSSSWRVEKAGEGKGDEDEESGKHKRMPGFYSREISCCWGVLCRGVMWLALELERLWRTLKTLWSMGRRVKHWAQLEAAAVGWTWVVAREPRNSQIWDTFPKQLLRLNYVESVRVLSWKSEQAVFKAQELVNPSPSRGDPMARGCRGCRGCGSHRHRLWGLEVTEDMKTTS